MASNAASSLLSSSALLREGLDLGRHHGEAFAGIAGARRLDDGVERQEVGLLRNVVDQLGDVAGVIPIRQVAGAEVGHRAAKASQALRGGERFDSLIAQAPVDWQKPPNEISYAQSLFGHKLSALDFGMRSIHPKTKRSHLRVHG